MAVFCFIALYWSDYQQSGIIQSICFAHWGEQRRFCAFLCLLSCSLLKLEESRALQLLKIHFPNQFPNMSTLLQIIRTSQQDPSGSGSGLFGSLSLQFPHPKTASNEGIIAFLPISPHLVGLVCVGLFNSIKHKPLCSIFIDIVALLVANQQFNMFYHDELQFASFYETLQEATLPWSPARIIRKR